MGRGWTSWRVFGAIAALIAIIAVKAEISRRRRAARLVTEQSALHNESSWREFVAPVAADVREITVAAPAAGAKKRRSKATADGPPRSRRLSRAVLVAGAAAVVLPAVVLIAGFSPARAVAATLNAEAVATEDGVVLMVNGDGFTPGTDVDIRWKGSDTGVTAVASDSGEVIAALPIPSEDGAATNEVVASDGDNQAAIGFDPVAGDDEGPASDVLGAKALTRVQVNGSPYFLLGADYPWNSYGNDFGQNAWGSFGVHSGGSYAADFADMKAKGVHVARWWVFADGRGGIDFAADGTPTGVQPVVFDDLSKAVALARQNNVYLDLVLFDVSLLDKPNFSGGVQMGGHTDLLTDPAKRAALINNVITPLAKAYGGDPAILSWELMNEPEWGISDLPQPAVGANTNPVTMGQFWAYGSAASQILHFYSRQQVTLGSAALKWNRAWTNAFAAKKGLPALNLDFYQTHYYPWMDCCSTNDPDLGVTTWSPMTQKASLLGLDKPIVVGEMHTPAGGGTALLDTILGNGYAGAWGWSYKSQNTGDQLQVDWPSFTSWEASHAGLVRIPAAGPAATPTARPTSTSTRVGPTPTKAPATPTKLPSTATATATRVSATATSTARPAATATNTAAPTPTAAGGSSITFGFRSATGQNDANDDGYINAASALLANSGTLRSLSIYVGATPAGAHIRLGLYGDNGGKPGALIGQTVESSASVGWNTLPVAPVSVNSGTYWIAAQTDDPGTVYRITGGMSPSSVVGWAPQTYGAFPNAVGGFWENHPANTFGMYGTVDTTASAGAAATPQPTISVPVGETFTPVPTSTRVPAATPTPTRTPTVSSGSGNCVSNCGNPRYFCDAGGWAFCDDFRGKTQGATHLPFPASGDPFSYDASSTSDPGYVPREQVDPDTGGNAFSANEHFMTIVQDPGVGIGILRAQQPFDFAGRTGHIHFDVDLKTSERRYVRMMLSPDLTKVGTDDRGATGIVRPNNAYDIWFKAQGFRATLNKNGSCGIVGVCFGNVFYNPRGTYVGTDDVRDSVDVYVSRTHTKIVVDGVVYADQDTPDIGFDRAYVYFTQAAYNPCKDGECSLALQTFHWDNIAFDGPALAANSLTPAGSEDVIFNAYSVGNGCSVKGVAAVSTSPPEWGAWVTWRARLAAGTPVSVSDITCDYNFVSNGSDTPRGLEIVKQ